MALKLLLFNILIEENCPKISQIYQAEDLLTGVYIITKEQPSIVFLDIEMPEHSGLEILNFIEKEVYNFEINHPSQTFLDYLHYNHLNQLNKYF